MRPFANASESQQTSPSVPARFAVSRERCGKSGRLRPCVTNMRALWEENNMAELTQEQLWKVCQRKPGDYEPYGKHNRLTATRPVLILSDCSGGCKWYHTLSGPAALDWGVCGNPRSHRVGLLTFEHQGCVEFEPE